KSNEMYYLRFTKVIIDYFMTRKPSIPRRNRVNWHYVRDDVMFSTIKVVLRHQTTQQYDKRRISLSNIGSSTDEGTGSRPGVLDVPFDDSEEELSWNSSDDEDVDEKTKGRYESEGDKTDESDDDDDDQNEAEKVNDADDDEEEISKIGEQKATESDEGDDEATESDRENNEDDDNNEEDQGLRMQEEEEADELYRDVDINQGWGLQVSQEIEDSHVTLTPTHSDGQQGSSSTSSFMTNLLNPLINPGMESIFTTGLTTVTPIPSPQSTMTPSIISTFTTASQLPTPPTQIPSLDLQSLLTFASQMLEAVREVVQTQTDRLQDSIQRENDEFLSTIDDKMKKIIKEQAKVLTRSSHSSRTSYAVAADLLEMELKKILIDKMEGNKSIQSAGRSTTGSQSRQLSASESAFAEEPVQTTCQMKEPSHPVFKTGEEDQPIIQTTQHPEWFSQPKRPPTPDRDWNKTLPAAQGNAHVDTLTTELLAGPTYELIRGSCNSLTEIEYHLDEVYKATTNQLDWVNPEGQQYPHNLLQPLPLIPDNRGRRVIPFEHFINNDLEYLRGVNRESALDVYSKRRIIAVTELKIVEWHNYKHLDWISVRRDDDKIYKFKEGYLKRLRIQDIKDMLLLLVQGKLTNLTVEERFAFNVSLRMFTRSIVIQRRVEDLQLGVESYQKRLNLTKPDTMQYLPTTIWRRGDKDRAAVMIQAIDKMLKTRRIMRSLERFVGGR
nr:hypothetical protein [Tanacetum cinerariifolium]